MEDSTTKAPRLSAIDALRLIEETDASDRETAGAAIRAGIDRAQEQWVAAHVIAESLAVELLNISLMRLSH